MQSSAASHLEPISPVVALWSDDRDEELMHFVLESPIIPNVGAIGVRESEVDVEKG